MALSEKDWDNLLHRIRKGYCTPFLGAGASAGRLPLASCIARKWAKDYEYPLSDDSNLARVAQFRAVTDDRVRPKEDMAECCLEAQTPDFDDPDEIHRTLAELPFSIYMTTNYDDFMFKALRYCDKAPEREMCRWHGYLADNFPSIFQRDPTYIPSPARPLVYHLHGYADIPQSMVLTEDDYLDFLVWFSREWSSRISQDMRCFPTPIVKALSGNSLLFIGYNRSDWNFRVVFRALVSAIATSMRRTSVAVQLNPLAEGASEKDCRTAEHYLESYFENIERNPVRVYWGNAQAFARELRNRWEIFKNERRTKNF